MGTANEIYDHTRNSLMTIVSANVADNTLESVLSASGLTQDTINADHMMQLIRGPIYREFQTIVPKEGLKKQLSKLLIELQNVEEPVLGLVGISQVPKAAKSSAKAKRAKTEKKAPPIRSRIPGVTTIKPNAIGIPRAYFRDPRDDAFNIQMPLFGTDPHVVLDNGTRAIVRYWVSDVALLDPDELKEAGFRRFSFMVEEESHPNPTIVKLLAMLKEEEEAEQESLMLERLAQEAKAAAERDIAEQEIAVANKATAAITITQEDLEQLADDYAELEDVHYMLMLRNDGKVLKTKGKGLEIERLKPALQSSMRGLSLEHFQAQYPEQLEHFSKFKSVLLDHASGVLFVLNYTDTFLVIYGSRELNIGLMYSYASRIGSLDNRTKTVA